VPGLYRESLIVPVRSRLAVERRWLLAPVPTKGEPMTTLPPSMRCGALLLGLFLAACGKTDVPAGPTASPGYDTGSAAEPPAPAAASAAAQPASAVSNATP
jgi:hypothetical protein